MAAHHLLRAAFAVSPTVPLTWRYSLGAAGGEAAYWLWPRKRHDTRRTMAIVTDDGTRGARSSHAARAAFRNYGRYIVDFFNLPHTSSEEILARTSVDGWENVDAALARGKGLIFATGHIGVWDYAPMLLEGRYPGLMNVVAESFSSPAIDRLIQGQRTALGSTVIPMDNVRRMVRVLRESNILAILIDRPVDKDGVPICFFGRPTLVPGGAATLASLTGAPIVPAALVRRADGGFHGIALPPIDPPESGERGAGIQRTTAAVFAALEDLIRRYPGQWYMFRDMWPARHDAFEDLAVPVC